MINSFPGYEHIPGPENNGKGRNMYHGIDVGFGGYVYAEPGMYWDVTTFDIASAHPTSMIKMNIFGERYTKQLDELFKLRIAIKHKDFDSARKMFNGALSKYLDSPEKAKALAKALKLAINQIYGMTSASFDNKFRDSRNVNNIVALRTALFLVTLREKIQEKGFQVISCKTDSIKVVSATKELQEFIFDFGEQYGYAFEVENHFSRICLVNDAVYIAYLADDDPEDPNSWTATGTQFAVPYVFKSLFSKDEITFEDFCETKSVSGSGTLYLDFNEGLEDVSYWENIKEWRRKYPDWTMDGVKLTKKAVAELEATKQYTDDEIDNFISKGHSYKFVGRVGSFCPIKEGCNGGILLRYDKNKYSSVNGSKGYRWMDAEIARTLPNINDILDTSYHQKLADDAVKTIEKFGSFDVFVNDVPFK